MPEELKQIAERVKSDSLEKGGLQELGQKKPVRWDEKERRFKLKDRAEFDLSWLPIIQNAVSVGCTSADLGYLMGYDGPDAKMWFDNLKANNAHLKQAVAAGKELMKAHHVAEMMRVAWGYEYEEETVDYKSVSGPQGELKEVQTGRTIHKRHAKPNARLMEFIATNLMPDQFKRTFEFNKKNIDINIKGELSKDQISRLAGDLLDAEVVDAKFVETENV